MQTEFEAVFVDIEKVSLMHSLKNINALLVQGRTLYKRIVYHLGDREVSKRRWLRLRDEGERVTLTVKEEDYADESIGRIGEYETVISDFGEMRDVLRLCGLQESIYEENWREKWVLDIDGQRVECCLDEWPDLFPYLEIEGANETCVKKVVALLGLDYAQAKFGNCFDRYWEQYGWKREQLHGLKEITFENGPLKQLA